MSDVRKMLNEFLDGIPGLATTNADEVGAFMNLLGATYQDGACDVKTKELISVGIAVYNRCKYCIVYHVYKGYEAGATREEMIDAAMVAVAFGGGPSMAYSATLLRECLDEFEGDFA